MLVYIQCLWTPAAQRYKRACDTSLIGRAGRAHLPVWVLESTHTAMCLAPQKPAEPVALTALYCGKGKGKGKVWRTQRLSSKEELGLKCSLLGMKRLRLLGFGLNHQTCSKTTRSQPCRNEQGTGSTVLCTSGMKPAPDKRS